MRKCLLFLICLLVFPCVSEAQVGFLGKRFVVKTNALSGAQKPFRGIEVEYVLKRNVTVSLGYSSNRKVTNFNFVDIENLSDWLDYQSYDGLQFDNLSVQNAFSDDFIPGFKTRVKESRLVNRVKFFDLNFRVYSNSYLSAPHGFYSQYGISIGKQEINGGIYYPNNIITYYNYNSQFYAESFESYNRSEKFVNFYFGLGQQFVIAKWVTLDFNLNGGIAFRGNTISATSNQNLTTNLNVISKRFPQSSSVGNLFWLGSDLTSQTGFFISGYVKLGILIF